MDNSLKSLIDSTNSLVIILPVKPYFDQVAAGLSLYLSQKGKKDVSIVCQTPMLVEFNRLVGVNKITSEVGNKNMVVSLGDYPAQNIERVSYDIEEQEFKLTIIPKTGMVPPTKHQVILRYSGVSADLVIRIGGAPQDQFPLLANKEFEGIKTAHIGVKQLSTSDNSQIISLAKPSSSVSELIGEYIKNEEGGFDQDMATNLLLGIEDATRNFTSDYVTADTFQMVADLMRAGARRERPTNPRNYPAGAKPSKIFNPKRQDNLEAIENKEEIIEQKDETQPPKEWLSPKIFKGTSVS